MTNNYDAMWRHYVPQPVNSLWPSDAIWRHRIWLTLVRVRVWCRQTVSLYWNKFWLITSEVLLHSRIWWQVGYEVHMNVTRNIFGNYTFKILPHLLGSNEFNVSFILVSRSRPEPMKILRWIKFKLIPIINASSGPNVLSISGYLPLRTHWH